MKIIFCVLATAFTIKRKAEIVKSEKHEFDKSNSNSFISVTKAEKGSPEAHAFDGPDQSSAKNPRTSRQDQTNRCTLINYFLYTIFIYIYVV